MQKIYPKKMLLKSSKKKLKYLKSLSKFIIVFLNTVYPRLLNITEITHNRKGESIHIHVFISKLGIIYNQDIDGYI